MPGRWLLTMQLSGKQPPLSTSYAGQLRQFMVSGSMRRLPQCGEEVSRVAFTENSNSPSNYRGWKKTEWCCNIGTTSSCRLVVSDQEKLQLESIYHPTDVEPSRRCIRKWDHPGTESVRQLQSSTEICKVFWEAQILRMHILQETRCCSIALLSRIPLGHNWKIPWSLVDFFGLVWRVVCFATQIIYIIILNNKTWNRSCGEFWWDLLKPVCHFKLNIREAPQVTSWMQFHIFHPSPVHNTRAEKGSMNTGPLPTLASWSEHPSDRRRTKLHGLALQRSKMTKLMYGEQSKVTAGWPTCSDQWNINAFQT